MPAEDATADIVTAAVLVVGDEILSGRTKDTNSGYIADYLTAVGIRLMEVRVVGDDATAIVEAVNALRQRYTYVFTTGGIGPTHDDITADAVASAFGVELFHHPAAVALLRDYLGPDRLNEARLRMARIPDGATLIENPISRAPGFMLANVIVMAGIPRIMQVMLDAVAPKLRKGRKLHAEAVRVEHPEGDVATVLGRLQSQHPDVQMGSYPFFDKGTLGTHVVLRATDRTMVERAVADLLATFAAAGLTRLTPVADQVDATTAPSG